jgi:2-polyprenyl-3-methyl-5-hydroxy-6-metoxy-1,4-benzoquinol methylase
VSREADCSFTLADVKASTDAAAAYERALVRSGWEALDLIGRLGTGQSKKLLNYRWESERERGAAWFRPLERPAEWAASAFATYETEATHTRFRRTLDFVHPGDKILEVGTGKGYTGGLFLRDGGAAGYLGIELVEKNVLAAAKVLALNGVDDRGRVVQGDLFAMDLPMVEEFHPDLVVCCEVLEHVEDPEKALQALADALPEDADLLISVPVDGRLETVWGHLAIFDAARTRAMVEGAGLHVHAVDVCEDMWTLILASHRAAPSPRAAAAAGAAADGRVPPPSRSGPRSFARLDLTSAGPARNPHRVRGQRLMLGDDQSVTCTVAANPRRLPGLGGHTGGLAFGIHQARGLRLELDLPNIDGLNALLVDAYDGTDLVARWRWDLTKRRPMRPKATYVFGAERPSKFFVPVRTGDLERADTVEVLAQVRAGATTTFRLARASVLR